MKRAFDPTEPELMDRPQPVSAELERDLDNLVSLNRLFGSHRLLRRFLAAWLQRDRVYRVLDVCTGAGDLPRLMVDWARARGTTLQIDAIDANASTLAIAEKRSADYPEIHFSKADALSYQTRVAYDFVHCSLALHHFSDEDAARLLRRCRELSNRFVLVSDLERHPLTTAGVWALTAAIYREPMTQFDGRLSARRAFSFAEMHALAELAGWKDFGHGRFLFCRQALWMEARDFAEIPQAAVAMDEGLPCPT
jgi:2-polyprenyl-3-methyl-5-hydroxy-6-metoxy-1,4-benzoquinol methylase